MCKIFIDQEMNKITILLLCLCVINHVSGRTGEVCFPFGHVTNDNMPEPEVIRGSPGKRGGFGPPGPQGIPGPPGHCACDPNEIEQLRQELHEFQGMISQMANSIATLNRTLEIPYCLAGMKDGRIPDRDLSASESHSSSNLPPRGRLDFEGSPGAWAAGTSARAGEWIQVFLGRSRFITGVVTQGRYDSDQWVTSFKLSYGNTTQNMQVVQSNDGGDMIFQGNRDRNTHVINLLPSAVVARYFRLIVVTWHSYPSLRMDYLIC